MYIITYYFRLYGCYEALQGGKIQDGLVDMTAGAGEVFDLTEPDKLPHKFFSFLNQLYSMNSLMGCSIPVLKFFCVMGYSIWVSIQRWDVVFWPGKYSEMRCNIELF